MMVRYAAVGGAAGSAKPVPAHRGRPTTASSEERF